MTASQVKPKDPLRAVIVSACGGRCQAAKRLEFGAAGHNGDRREAVKETCGKPIEGVFYYEDRCHECRMQILGLTSGEKRKRTMKNKEAQQWLVAREEKKP